MIRRFVPSILAPSLLVLSLAACSDDDDSGRLDLTASLSDPYLGGSLMPFIPPDPWDGRVRLTVTNPADGRAVRNLRVTGADIIEADGGAVRGSIRFEDESLGDLAPGATRQVQLEKRTESSSDVDQAICGRPVFFRLTLAGRGGETTVDSQAFTPACVH
jgi:hypothetical protein